MEKLFPRCGKLRIPSGLNAGAAFAIVARMVPKTKKIAPVLLTDLPNIGPTVARLLAAAGIRTPAQLRRLGAAEAARRIRAIRPGDPPCRSLLAGLEGAIRGVRWHAIPAGERARLWADYEKRPGEI